MNNGVSGKFMENIWNDRDIKLVTTKGKRIYIVLEPNYQTRDFFSDNLLRMEIKRTRILINKPLYLGLLKLEISKIRMYECMGFGMSTWNQNMVKKQNCFLWIDTVL